ncbi:hypothetical protein KP509_28G064400 [Ceratopteris richardii]|nr:hypothetical protein KP509_28G064400 [Ceratopteris richardii]
MDMSASLASLMGGPRIVKTPVNTSHVPTFPTPLTPSFLSANRTPSSKRASCVPMGNGRFETKHNDEIMCMLLKGESFHWNAARFPEEHVFTTMMAQNLDDTNEISYTSMVTVACPNCLMFVMLSRSNPKCPRCGISCVEQMASSQPSCKRSKSHLF